jgi:hypothetical protein
MLEVTAVRVERLQSITEEDAGAEGIRPLRYDDVGHSFTSVIPVFANLWDRINGKRAPWSANPWVWVVSFRSLAPRAREGEG